MKFIKILNIKNFIYYLLYAIFIPLSTKIQSSTLIQNEKLIYINSSQEIINLKKQSITFKGKVRVKCNSININADKVIFLHKNYKYKNKVVEFYGTPVQFYQTEKNNKIFIKGTSQVIYYEICNNLIKFIGNVYLKYGNNTIKSRYVIYKINDKKFIESKN